MPFRVLFGFRHRPICSTTWGTGHALVGWPSRPRHPVSPFRVVQTSTICLLMHFSSVVTFSSLLTVGHTRSRNSCTFPSNRPLPSPSAQSTPTRWTSGLGSATETQQPPEKRRETRPLQTPRVARQPARRRDLCLTVRVLLIAFSNRPPLSHVRFVRRWFFSPWANGNVGVHRVNYSLFYCGLPSLKF